MKSPINPWYCLILAPFGSVLTIDTEYRPNCRIRAPLAGPNGGLLRVVALWMNEEALGTTKFVTLFPDKL